MRSDRVWTKTTDAADRARTTTAETAPSPGIRTVAQQIAQSSASPTGGESHDQPRTPQISIAACPIESEEAQIRRVAT